MGTILYLRCVTHQPWIESGEVGYNLNCLTQIRKDLANREKMTSLYNLSKRNGFELEMDTLERQNTIRFLANHESCTLQLWDEYDRRYSIVGDNIVDDAVVDYEIIPTTDLDRQLHNLLNAINAQIEVINERAAEAGVLPTILQNKDGSFVMNELLLAKAQTIYAMVALR